MVDEQPQPPSAGEQACQVHERLVKSIEDVDVEIVQLAVVCGIHILDRGVIARVLHNDSMTCDHPSLRAFEKLRMLLMMHYALSDKALAELGPDEGVALLDNLMTRLRHRFGEKLGGRLITEVLGTHRPG